MAVVTAAITAVAAAVATTTAATVATAVVAVSTAIGVTGAVVGVIGAATGNEDLMFAGKIMGYVGMGGALAGGVIGGLGAVMGNSGLSFTQGFGDAFAGASQHISNAWDKGVGSWFSSGGKVTGAVDDVAGAADDVAGAADDVALKSVPTGTSSSPNGQMASFPEVTAPGKSVVYPGDGVTVAAPKVGGGAVPTAPTVAPPTAPTTNFPSVGVGGASPGAAAESGGMISSVSNSFSNMPDWMKYSLMTTAGQGITGMASGYFQGEQAEQQLEHQKVIAQRDEAQRQRLNQFANEIPVFGFR